MKLTDLERNIILRALDEWEWQGAHGQLGCEEDAESGVFGGFHPKSDQEVFDTFDDFKALHKKLSEDDQ
jgi:hypothetical protein